MLCSTANVMEGAAATAAVDRTAVAYGPDEKTGKG